MVALLANLIKNIHIVGSFALWNGTNILELLFFPWSDVNSYFSRFFLIVFSSFNS